MRKNTVPSVNVRTAKMTKGRLSVYLDFYPAVRNPQTNRNTRREYLGQLVDVKSLVIFRGCELVGFAVLIDKDSLVAAHGVVGTERTEILDSFTKIFEHCFKIQLF